MSIAGGHGVNHTGVDHLCAEVDSEVGSTNSKKLLYSEVIISKKKRQYDMQFFQKHHFLGLATPSINCDRTRSSYLRRTDN